MNDQSKKIIFFFIILFILSSIGLFCAEKYYKNSADNNWWVVYFENPKSEDLNFIIESNTASGNFKWELWQEERKIKEGNELINKGDEKTIRVENILPNNSESKNSIKIFFNNEKKEIYKNF